MRFKFIHAERVNYPVRLMCRVLRVSTSGYYAQMKRAPSKRQCEDGKLKLRIQAIHSSLDYNSPMVFERIHDLKTAHAR